MSVTSEKNSRTVFMVKIKDNEDFPLEKYWSAVVRKTYFMGVFSHGQDINVGALWKVGYLKKLFSRAAIVVNET